MTNYIKDKLNKIVCGIGDGGNDVGMIQCANVGIGIEGKEGLQACLASDYSVSKFKHLQTLILWHGRLSYFRTSLLANFVIHRGLIITVIQTHFMVTFYFVAQNIYNGWLTMCYVSIFTTLPIFSLILDEDISKKEAFNYPSLYSLAQKGQNLTVKIFFVWVWKSIFQGSVVFILTIQLFDYSYLQIVTITFTSLIIIEYLNIYSLIRSWQFMNGVSVLLSLFFYLFSLFFLKREFQLSELRGEELLKIVFLSIASWLPL